MGAPIRETKSSTRRRPAPVIALHPCVFCGAPSTRISDRLDPETKEQVTVTFCTKHHKAEIRAWQTRKKIFDFLTGLKVHPCVINAMMEANIGESLEHGLP